MGTDTFDYRGDTPAEDASYNLGWNNGYKCGLIAARATSTPAGLRKAASDLADAVDTYLDNKRSPELWVADRARVWKAAKEVRAALQGADR